MSILHPKVVPLLVGGFALVILLMLATGKRGLDALGELERGTSGLLSEERANAKALNKAQDLEIAFDQIYYSVPGAPRHLAPDDLRERLAALEREAARTAQEGLEASGEPAEAARWREFDAAARTFIEAAGASMGSPGNESLNGTVTDAHERVANAVGQMVRDTDRRTERLALLDHAAFSHALEQHVTLLALAVLLALVVAASTVFLVERLLKRMEWQRLELARLSSDMLHAQEATLRRVSHDLHDQFGQTLTAIEANLAALDAALPDRRVKARVEDCIGLVQDLMGHARGMSQLLRPSILDDFGLSPSLEWLSDRFSQRTGIDVRYASDFDGRLDDQVETHLFRIAQEACTNVSRHAVATRVDMTLSVGRAGVELVVADNGRGMSKPSVDGRGMGLRTMRARAGQIGGTLAIEPRPEGGTRVSVRAPIARIEAHEPQDTRIAG